MAMILTDKGINRIPQPKKTMEEKIEIGKKVERHFTSVSGESAQPIRLSRLCRNCAIGTKHGNSIYCAECIQEIARLSSQQNVNLNKTRRIIIGLILFGIAAALFYASFSPDTPPIQRPDTKVTGR